MWEYSKKYLVRESQRLVSNYKRTASKLMIITNKAKEKAINEYYKNIKYNYLSELAWWLKYKTKVRAKPVKIQSKRLKKYNEEGKRIKMPLKLKKKISRKFSRKSFIEPVDEPRSIKKPIFRYLPTKKVMLEMLMKEITGESYND